MGILFPGILADKMSLKPGPCNVGRGPCPGARTLGFLEEVIALEPGPWTKFRDARHALRMFRRPRHPNVVLFHGDAPLPETFEFALVMERVQGVTRCSGSPATARRRLQALLQNHFGLLLCTGLIALDGAAVGPRYT
jgi:hypothetical protein